MNVLNEKLVAFFASYDFDVSAPEIDGATKALFYDMKVGLENELAPFTQEMLPTWIQVKKPRDKRVIVLDAGGTNFRSFLVEIKNGKAKILKLKKGLLPAVESELTKDEFFEKIAENIEYLKDEVPEINFCFAYALQMTPDKDAKVLRMSKEIKVKGILNELVGESLFEVLKKKGWKKLTKISVINDTAAALLSGLSLGKEYSSYIGMILGTGFNIAYIESEPIKKLKENEQLLNQIVVCETAKTNRVVGSCFDIELRKQTIDGELCKLEKICAGAYLGDLISICFRHACKDKIFTKNFASAFEKKNFSFQTINEFLTGENLEDNEIITLIKKISASNEDLYLFKNIAVNVLERVARVASAALIAVALKTKQGRNASSPICIVAEGTTFKKAFGLKKNVEKFLTEHLTKKYGVHFELHEIENAIALGAAYFS